MNYLEGKVDTCPGDEVSDCLVTFAESLSQKDRPFVAKSGQGALHSSKGIGSHHEKDNSSDVLQLLLTVIVYYGISDLCI